jgi:NADH-quinone oxidoreductase subunit N
MKNFYKNVFNYIYHVKSTYASQLIRLFLITFLFVLGVIYCIVIEPISLNMSTYYLWIEVLFFIVLLIILVYGGVLYCFTNLKNSQIADELLNLSLCLHVVSLFSFIFLGVATDFLYGNKLFLFNNYYSVDFYNYIIKVWILFFSIFSIFLSKFIISSSRYNLVEYPVLISLSSFLLMTVISLYDLFAIFIVIESIFFTTMCLSLFNFSRASVESCVKYFIQNVFVAGLSGFGIFIIYFVCKSTNIFVVKEAFKVFIYLIQHDSLSGETRLFAFFFFLGIVLFLLSILFKIGVFPVHFYVPDIYETSPYPIVFFFSAVVKPAFLFFFIKLIYLMFYPFTASLFQIFFIYIALASTLIGVLGALHQNSIKRFLGYTSINQFGFFILIFFFTYSVDVIIFIFIYLFIYCLLLVPFIYIMSFVGERRSKKNSATISQFSELAYLNDFNFKYIMSFSFFFISGLPPFLLFFYKYYLLLWLFFTNHYFVVIYLLILHVLSLTYYLKIIKSILFDAQKSSRKLIFVATVSFNFMDEVYRKAASFLKVFLFFFILLVFVFLFKFDLIFMNLQFLFWDALCGYDLPNFN